MFDMKNAKTIEKDICLYDETLQYEVRIVEWHTLYGSGDYEDSPEISNDSSITCYYIWFENLLVKGEFSYSGGGYLSIDDAVSHVEKTSIVEWEVNPAL